MASLSLNQRRKIQVFQRGVGCGSRRRVGEEKERSRGERREKRPRPVGTCLCGPELEARSLLPQRGRMLCWAPHL